MTKRDPVIDRIKGMAIVCVVLGHSGFSYTQFLYLFHMAVFFLASGYLYRSSSTDSRQNLLQYIKRKLMGLWAPFVIWNSVFTLLHNVFLKLNIYTNCPELPEYVGKNYGAALVDYWTGREMLINIAKSFVMHGGTVMGGTFWFLAVLFRVSVIYALCDYFFRRLLKKCNTCILQGILSALLLMLGFWCQKQKWTLHGLAVFCSCYGIFYLGVCLGTYHRRMETASKQDEVWRKCIPLIVSIILLLIGDRFRTVTVSLGSNRYPDPVFLILMSLAGWVMLYEAASLLELLWERLNCRGFFAFVGQYTRSILIFQFLAFKPVSLIGIYIYGHPNFVLGAFPVAYCGGGWWLAYTLAGIFLPMMVGVLWRRTKTLCSRFFRFS